MFSFDEVKKRFQKQLIQNTLSLCKAFIELLKQKNRNKEIPHTDIEIEKKGKEESFEQAKEEVKFYGKHPKKILESIEKYDYLPSDEAACKSLAVYYFEKIEKKSIDEAGPETLYQYLYLTDQRKWQNEEYVVGTTSKKSEVLKAITEYIELINSPNMVKKRDYMFNSIEDLS